MAYSQLLADRVRAALKAQRGVREKKMFGGLAFMLRGNMCCGVLGEDLVVRVGPAAHEKALARAHARPMDFTHKPMRGYVYVTPKGYAKPAALRSWLTMVIAFVGSLPRK